ncbi:MAG: HPr family phosphocarrier protein [Pseudomonadota bacterium]|jgi:phosphocarrier protein HPr|nr:HPr family phosphocarrier protein [Rubrivivax sp.]MCA3259656.1 HPr family phosphocarrier protein [Rubrivivax sp.]MCE2911358.1 HPr family phosphocarrier protein [Rubrivivax sp.]MCZ8032003.1 HPr family phosphocarrier protein [Rubrivivax sp.]
MQAEGTVLLLHAAGLHARPAVTLTKTAKTFRAKVQVAADPAGPWIDAKSVVRVMGMKTPARTLLHLRAEGDDAQAAVDALVRLVNDDFQGGPE